jgi:hypothetical protein
MADSMNPMLVSNPLAAIPEDEMECDQASCGHASFKMSAKGCNPIMRLCPACNEQLDDNLSGAINGKSLIIIYIL